MTVINGLANRDDSHPTLPLTLGFTVLIVSYCLFFLKYWKNILSLIIIVIMNCLSLKKLKHISVLKIPTNILVKTEVTNL